MKRFLELVGMLVGLLLIAWVALLLLCAVASAAEKVPGAGTVRHWTTQNGVPFASIEATYSHTSNGFVFLVWTHTVMKNNPNGGNTSVTVHKLPNGTPIMSLRTPSMQTESKPITQQIKVSLANLSVADRKWVENTDPAATCLKENSPKGRIGTLTPASGSYTVDKKIDATKAILSYSGGAADWTFQLHSEVVRKMEVGKTYQKIAGKPDFWVTKKSDGETIVVDNP